MISLEVILEITEIFEILDEKNYKHGMLLKKKSKIYLPFSSTEIRLRLPLKHDMDFIFFVEDARDQINVFTSTFLEKTTEKEKKKKSKKIDDFMDRDYIEKPIHNNVKRENNYY